MTNSINELIDSNVIFISGSNTTENHPVIGAKIRQAKKNGAKIIVVDPRKIDIADDADVFLQVNPGTNIALSNAIMNYIISERLEDVEYVKERTENYDELVSIVGDFTPEKAAEICGVSAEDIKKAARMYAEGEKGSIVYCMGVTQHSSGTEGVMSMANLAMLCGNIGIESGGVNPLRGQNNVQGACDMGALPGTYPAYQKVVDANVKAKFEEAWGVRLSDKVGLTLTEIVHKAGHGDIKFLYIMGENPMVSDPDLTHVEEALKNTEFLVVQDIFLTETAQLADVVLPAASFAEKDGTFSNTERRVQRVRKAINPIGDCKPDWQILSGVLKRLGIGKDYAGPEDVFAEIREVTPSYAGISYDRLNELGSLQWPCPTEDHAGTKFLHVGKFARGLGLFKPAAFKPSAEVPCDEYPVILTTGRVLYHYHTRTMTGKVDGLNAMSPESFVEINPEAARKLSIAEGDKVKVSTRRGSVVATAKVTPKLKENVVFMPFHFADGAANALTNPVLDPIAKIPEYKSCAAKLEKVAWDWSEEADGIR
jgi:formate dehydrogenase major subunit